MKACLICQIVKDIFMFYSMKSEDQTFHSVCNKCRAEGYTEPQHVLDEEL